MRETLQVEYIDAFDTFDEVEGDHCMDCRKCSSQLSIAGDRSSSSSSITTRSRALGAFVGRLLMYFRVWIVYE